MLTHGWQETVRGCWISWELLTERARHPQRFGGFRRCAAASALILAVIAVLGIAMLAGIPGRPGSQMRGADESGVTPKPLTHLSALPALARHVHSGPVLPRLDYVQLPLSFEANQGQAPGVARFISSGLGYFLLLTPDGAIVALNRTPRPSSKDSYEISDRIRFSWLENAGYGGHPDILKTRQQDSSLLRFRLVGSNQKATPSGVDMLPGKSNHFEGSDPRKWRRGIDTFSRVYYSEVYPGVDLVFYGNQRRLEFDFRVAPGADFNPVTWELQGTGNSEAATSLDFEGNLLVHLQGGTLQLDKPIAYEILDSTASKGGNRRRYLNARYTLKGTRAFGFEVANHDPTKMLVIDPILQYSTYLGGSLDDSGNAIAVDLSGNVYVTGQTFSTNFPTLDAAQGSCVSCTNAAPAPDVFVTELDAAGTALTYSTYLGGSAADIGLGIAVDSQGSAYVTGATFSTDFPTTSGAFQTDCASCKSSPPLSDGFVTKLDAKGSVVYSTYLGGNQNDQGSAIAVDSSGNVYLTGATASTDFPTTPGAYQAAYGGGSTDAFLAELDPSGTSLLNSTFLGGSNADSGSGIAVDSSGIYLAGQTSSNNFPTVSPFQAAFTGPVEGFIAKFKQSGSSLSYSTYLGGSATNQVNALAIDSSGNAYVTGSTSSTDFPTTSDAFQTAYGGGSSDAFVSKIDPTGVHLVYSSYLGGSGQDVGNGISVDTSGTANIVGETYSSNFPTVNPIQATFTGTTDAFITRFVPSGCAPDFSTFFGGHSTNIGTGIAVDSSGNAYVTGGTTSNDFPVQSPFQPTTGGDSDAFVARMNKSTGPAACLSASSVSFLGQVLTTSSTAQSITLTNGGSSALSVGGVTTSGDFAQTNTCGDSVAAGSNCAVEVTFSPTTSGIRTGTLTITSTAGGALRSVPLSGVGTDFGISVYPASSTVTAGNSASYTVTLTPVSGFNSSVSLKCGGAPSTVNCSFSSAAPTMSGTSATTVTVTVSTEARNGSSPFSKLRGPDSPGGARGVMLLVAILLAFVLFLQARKVSRNVSPVSCLRVAALTALLGLALLLPSCGFSSKAPTGTQPGSYVLTVTGADGALQHSTEMGLTVD